MSPVLTLPSELVLAAACCRWPMVPEAEHRVRTAAAAVEDWDHFDEVVVRNRISPLVNHALAKVKVELPRPAAERLSKRAQIAARRALTMAREAVRLQSSFDAAGLRALNLKGVSVAILAYGEVGMKESCDIDLLVAPEALGEAIELLGKLGYESSVAPLHNDQFDNFVSHAKEAGFYNLAAGISIDLHWGLIDNRRLLRGVDVNSPAQTVSLPGGQLRTLADEELFTYLCLHGASHNWRRLKWLADLGGLLSRRSEREIEDLCRAAERLGVSRSASVALALCRSLFGISFGGHLPSAERKDRMSIALERNVLKALAYEGGRTEHTAYTIPWLRDQTALFLLEPGVGHTLAQAWTLWNFPGDRLRVGLPRRLSFLYPLLRAPIWLGRMGARALRHVYQ